MRVVLSSIFLIIFLTSCKTSISDGWYISCAGTEGVKKTFSDYGDIVTSINPNPILLKENILSITVDSTKVDSQAIRLGLTLSKQDSVKWYSTIRNSFGEELYFFMNDTLVDFQRIKDGNNTPEIWLSSMDHSIEQANKIIKSFKITQ